MNKNLKYSFQTQEKNPKTPIYLHSNLRQNASSSLFSRKETDNYLELNQFRKYRDSMIKKINAEQINNSFLEIRQLISSLKDVASEPTQQNFPSYLKKEPIKVPSMNSTFAKYEEAEIYYENNTSILSKSKGSLSNVNKSKMKKDQVSKLLTNLHIYINNSLNEINELKSSIKTSALEKIASETAMPKLDLFEGGNTKEKGFNDLQLNNNNEDPILMAEKKVHKIEVEKLLMKIKVLNVKENKLMERIESLKTKETMTLNNINQGIMVINAKVTGLINEEVFLSETDKKKFYTNLIYESFVLIITKKSLIFYKSLSDEKESMIIESSSIIDVSYYLKELPIDLNSSIISENELNSNENFLRDEKFNGFQIKLASKMHIFVKLNNFIDMMKFDKIFFLTSLSRMNANIELFFKFSKNVNLNSMQELDRNSPSIRRGNNLSSLTDFDFSNKEKRASLLGRNENDKAFVKKKSILQRSQLSDESINKKLKIGENLYENGQNKRKLSEVSQSNTLLKDSENIMTSKMVKLHSFYEKKDAEYRLLKAVKILKNGFCFMKYGNYGDPHERMVYLNCEKPNMMIEWRDYNKKKSNGSFDINNILEIKEGELKNVKKAGGGEEKNFFCIVVKNMVVNLESGNEKTKREFIESLRIIMQHKN